MLPVLPVLPGVAVAVVAGGATLPMYIRQVAPATSHPRGATELERYTLEIQALPDDVPAVVRLRRVLKSLLRGYRFRCLSAVRTEISGGQTAPVVVPTVDDVTTQARLLWPEVTT